MDLFDVVRACARRWYITVPLLLVTLIVSGLSYVSVETKYYGTTVLGIAPAVAPQSPGSGLPSNGLMDTGGIGLLSNLLSLGLQDEAVRTQIEADGGLPDYTSAVYAVPGGQLPLVTVEATASDTAAVERTLTLVTQQAQTTLKQIQEGAGVVAVTQATTYPVRPPTAPEARKPGRARTTVAIFVVGFALSVLISVVADVMITRRRRTDADAPDDTHSENATYPVVELNHRPVPAMPPEKQTSHT